MTELHRLASQHVLGRWRHSEISTDTRKSIIRTLNGLCSSHGNRPMNQFGTATIDRWLDTHRHCAPSTRRMYLSRARIFCRWLVAQGQIKQDPTRDIRPIKQPRQVTVTLTASQIDSLVQSLPDLRAKVVVALMWNTCARCAEVARLRVEDYDPASQTVFLRGKGGHERVIPTGPATAALIDRYLDEVGATGGPLLRSHMDPSKGLSPRTLSAYVRGWMEGAGVKRRAHDGRSAHALRRTGASEIMESCGDVRMVQAVLGHANIETTARHYLRAVPLSQMRAAMELREGERHQDTPDGSAAEQRKAA